MEEIINNISLGDCFELMPKIPDKSIDMILCDLPYMITKIDWDKDFDLKVLWKEYERIIKDNGAIVLTASSEFTFKLYNSNPQMYRYKWIWVKSKAARFLSTKYLPLATTEDVMVFYKKSPTYNPQKRKGFNTYTRKRTVRSKLSNVYSSNAQHKHSVSYSDDGTRHPIDLLRFTSVNNQYQIHPTQKPVELFEYMIKTYTNENELVLDNCSGSATTAIACLKTNRKYICMEKDEKYHRLSVNRVNLFKQKLEQGLQDE